MRFQNDDKNQILDWESAKEYAVDIMEFFGSRTVWTEMRNIINPDENDDFPGNSDDDDEADDNARPSTSQINQLDALPNDIEYEE